jgi:acyl transferase domain-containing protein
MPLQQARTSHPMHLPCPYPAGVYAGCMYSEYTTVITSRGVMLPPQGVVGSGLSYLVGRISYIFGFTGGLQLQTMAHNVGS